MFSLLFYAAVWLVLGWVGCFMLSLSNNGLKPEPNDDDSGIILLGPVTIWIACLHIIHNLADSFPTISNFCDSVAKIDLPFVWSSVNYVKGLLRRGINEVRSLFN